MFSSFLLEFLLSFLYMVMWTHYLFDYFLDIRCFQFRFFCFFCHILWAWKVHCRLNLQTLTTSLGARYFLYVKIDTKDQMFVVCLFFSSNISIKNIDTLSFYFIIFNDDFRVNYTGRHLCIRQNSQLVLFSKINLDRSSLCFFLHV